MRPGRFVPILFALALTAPANLALAQPPPAAPNAPIVPPPAKPPVKQAPPRTDMEIDPDAKPAEPAPLPPADPNAWGVGGSEEEGKFAPPAKKKDSDEEEDKKPVDLGRPGVAGVDTVIGFGSMRDVTNDADKTSITVASLVFGARYRLGERWTLSARFPLSTGSITGPKGGTDPQPFNQTAIGNVEIAGRFSLGLTRRLRLPIDLAVYLPTAQGDLFPLPAEQGLRAQGLVNQAAAYSRGWEDNPLFAAKRLGLRVGAGVTYDREALHITGGTRFDLMGKVGGNVPCNGTTPPEGAEVPDDGSPVCIPATAGTEEHSPTITWSLYGSLFYEFLGGKLTPGLRTWLAYATLPYSGLTRDYSGAQFVLEPQVNTRWNLTQTGTLAINGGVGVVINAGGHLGGANDASTTGLRLHASLLF